MATRTPGKTKKNKKIVVAITEGLSELQSEIPNEISTDARKVLFLQLYFDRESPTFGNALQSGIRAGFSREYSECITYQKPKWFSEFLGKLDFVNLAETHLKEVLMLPNVTQAMGAFGPIYKIEEVKIEKKYKNGKTKLVKQKIKVPVMVANVSVIKEKTLASKIILPAHDPKYKSSTPGGSKFSFNFNVKEARREFGGGKITDVKSKND